MVLDSNTHIYSQIIDDIKKKAVRGEMLPGEKLPSVRRLAELYQINPNTAARIYREMEAAGLSFTRKGLGTFLTADAGKIREMKADMAERCLSRFIGEMQEFGFEKAEIISFVKDRL